MTTTRTRTHFRAPILATALLAMPFTFLASGANDDSSQDKAALIAAANQHNAAQRFDEAIEACDRALAIDPTDALAKHRKGYALHYLGRLDEAYALFREVAEGNSPHAIVSTFNLGCVHALKNESDQAFEWLGRWSKMTGACKGELDGDADFTNLREDPRYKALRDSLPNMISVYRSDSPRASFRLAYFDSGSPGQMAVDYGPVTWQDKYKEALGAGKYDGRRWRLGQDFWTTLDTSMTLRIAGQILEPGQYYLVARRDPQSFTLIALDPKAVRANRTDPSGANGTTGGTEIPMRFEQVDDVIDELAISFEMQTKDTTLGQLVIEFGPFRLSADLEVVMPNP